MAAIPFTPEEWGRIRDERDREPERYGFPARRADSLLLGSFNIRKLGTKSNRDEDTWQFLADVCARFERRHPAGRFVDHVGYAGSRDEGREPCPCYRRDDRQGDVFIDGRRDWYGPGVGQPSVGPDPIKRTCCAAAQLPASSTRRERRKTRRGGNG